MPSELSGSYSFNILLVEDNPGDARLAQEALTENHVKHILYHVEDGLQALAKNQRASGPFRNKI